MELNPWSPGCGAQSVEPRLWSGHLITPLTPTSSKATPVPGLAKREHASCDSFTCVSTLKHVCNAYYTTTLLHKIASWTSSYSIGRIIPNEPKCVPSLPIYVYPLQCMAIEMDHNTH